MTTTHRARTGGATAALLVAATMLSGCGGKDAAADPPASSGSSSSDSSPASPSPSAEPASGDLMDTATASINAPKGWKVTTPVKDQTVVGSTKYALSSVGLSVVSQFGAHYGLDKMAGIDLRTGTYTQQQHLPDVEIAGQPAFHVHGRADAVRTYDAYGLEHDGYTVTVVFELHEKAAQRQQIIDSVLATLVLK